MKAILEKIPHEEWDAAVQKISFRLWPMFGIAVAMAITAACILFFVAPAAIGTERLDQQGDPLPKGALIWLGNIRFRAEGYISSVAFSPDGRLVAAGDSEGLVYLWESATGKPVRRLDASDRARETRKTSKEREFFSRKTKTLRKKLSARGVNSKWPNFETETTFRSHRADVRFKKTEQGNSASANRKKE